MYERRSRLPSYQQGELLKMFVVGATARAAAEVGIHRNTAAGFFMPLRKLIASKLPSYELSGEVEAATLERGDHRFRFYLSPEQIERGRISSGEPYAWHIQAIYGSATSEPLPNTPVVIAVSERLRDSNRLARFKQLMDEQKESRAGILLPQVETPFRDMYASETPVLKGCKRGN